MAKVKGQIKTSVRKKPVKAGSTHRGNTGGIANAKMAAIVRKRKSK